MNKLNKYFLKTKRLGFRQWLKDDLDIAKKLWGDYKVTQFIDARGKLSETAVKDRLALELRCHKEYGVQYWPIFLLDTNAHVGCCGLKPYNISLQTYEIGFHIRSNLWRCGYGREAATAAIEYAFNSLKIKSLFAGHGPYNEASRNLLLQIGFKYTHDEYYPPTRINHACYLLRENKYPGGKQ